jgi:hypothetical protein
MHQEVLPVPTYWEIRYASMAGQRNLYVGSLSSGRMP